MIGSHTIAEVRGWEDVPVEPDDFINIELTHREWQFIT
jgi:hypothetical protein